MKILVMVEEKVGAAGDGTGQAPNLWTHLSFFAISWIILVILDLIGLHIDGV